MQTVSADYKAAMSQSFRNRSYVQIVLGVLDNATTADASLSDSGHAPFSDVAGINTTTLTPSKLYATAEYNRMSVDGALTVVPDNGKYAAQGYCSNAVSGADCTFSANPIITLSFSTTHSIIGFTLIFDPPEGLYCTDFIIRAYAAGTLINTFTVAGNTLTTYSLNTAITGFDRLQIEFVKTSQPNNRVHAFGVGFGLIETFNNGQIIDDGITQDTAVDPISSALPTAKLTFSIANYDGAYNPDNPAGMYAYLQQRQPVNLKYGYDVGNGVIEWMKGGRYYLTDWTTPANKQSATFTGGSLLDGMQQIYTKGVYNPAGATLYDLADVVFRDAGLPKSPDGTDPWHIDNSLKNIKTTAPLPNKAQRELLQLIANAGMCVLFPDRDGVIHIEPIQSAVAGYYLDLDTASEYPENALSTPVQEVDVKVYTYQPDAAQTAIYSGSVAISGTQTVHIDFSGTAYSGAAATVTGGTLVSASYYAYSCDLTITANGTATMSVTGYKLNSTNTTAIYTKNPSGEVCPVDNPIITDPANAANIAKWIADYLNLRRMYTVPYRGEPALDATDIIAMQTQYTASFNARILESIIKFDTALSGTLTLKGMA